MRFAKRVKDLRENRRIGQKTIAPILGVSHTYVSHIESGREKPSPGFVRRVSEYFDQDPEEMMLLAEIVPDSLKKILYRNPKKGPLVLRETFRPCGSRGGKQK
jgi:transcriptional regulator with XRE-family HTH domain